MRPRILLTILLTALFVILSGCGTVKNCPVCGTTTGGTYANIDVISVPEHNPTGEPGGPFNSFDIGVDDPVHHKFFVSDRVGLVVAVFDTDTNIATNVIGGPNSAPRTLQATILFPRSSPPSGTSPAMGAGRRFREE